MGCVEKLKTLKGHYKTWRALSTALCMTERQVMSIVKAGSCPKRLELLLDYIINEKQLPTKSGIGVK